MHKHMQQKEHLDCYGSSYLTISYLLIWFQFGGESPGSCLSYLGPARVCGYYSFAFLKLSGKENCFDAEVQVIPLESHSYQAPATPGKYKHDIPGN